jgi:hypothetical protein
METATVGKVIVSARIDNVFDLYDADRGRIADDLQGRACSVDVSEVSEDCPVLIGYVPLELLDFVVNPKGQSLIGNPERGGELIFDMF